jgi:hypothetical protein
MTEDYGFNIDGLLSEEEAAEVFDKIQNEEEQPEKKEENDDSTSQEEKETPIEKEHDSDEDDEPSEKVDLGKEGRKDAAEQEDGGSSPDQFYSSIAIALKDDGILPDFDNKELESIKSPEDFAELFEKAITSRFDERTRRIDEALNNGVAPDTVRDYEQTLQYLHSINDAALSAEGEEAEDLRRQIIFNDLITRGYSEEKANREVEKSFKSNTDIEDAKDSLAALISYHTKGYENIRNEAKRKETERREKQKQDAEKFKKMVLEDEITIGDTKLDKRTCQRIYDAVYRPVYKDEETGRYLTQVQKFQKENPLEFLKQLGMWFVLTDNGKDIKSIVSKEVRMEKNKSIRELERKINFSARNSDGSLRYAGGSGGDEDRDPLMSDGWQVGWK